MRSTTHELAHDMRDCLDQLSSKLLNGLITPEDYLTEVQDFVEHFGESD